MPAVPLAAATTFNVTVAPMTAIDGSAMSEPYTFSFSDVGAHQCWAQNRPASWCRRTSRWW